MLRMCAFALLGALCLFAQNTRKPPKLLKTVPIDYPEEARLANVSGTVKLQVPVGSDGHVLWVKVTREAGSGMDEAAVENVRKWTFQPAEDDGQPVVGTASVEVNFRK